MKRFAFILVLVFLAMGAGIGVLAWRVVEGLDRQQETNHWVVAGSVFNECEREMNLFLGREEDRPFAQYDYFYLPRGLVPGSNALSRSPLAEAPKDAWVEGYFQVDLERGTYHNPAIPYNGRLLALAKNSYGYDGPPLADQPFDLEVGRWLGIDLGLGDMAEARSQLDQAADTQSKTRVWQERRQSKLPQEDQGYEQSPMPPEWSSLGSTYNRNSSVDVKGPNAQSTRTVKVQQLNEAEAARYANADGNVHYEQALVEQQAELQNRLQQYNVSSSGQQSVTPAPIVQAGQESSPGPVGASAPGLPSKNKLHDPGIYLDEIVATLADNDLVDVEARVHPFAAAKMDAGRLVLQRQVEVGPRRLRQGLVMAPAILVDALRSGIIAVGPLAGQARLDWAWADDPAPASTAGLAYRYRHRLPEPFAGVALHLALPVLAGERVEGHRFVVLLAVGLIAALGIGFIAIHRMVGTRLEFARRRSDFVSAVTHELKTPLTSIRMYGEMLAEDMVPDDAKRRQYYRTITAEGERLGRLVDNVLELAKLEHGTRGVLLVAGDPREVVEEALGMLRPHATNQGFALDLAEAPVGTPQAIFDRDALLQVVVNLVDNGIKFSAAAADKRVSVCFDVLDHGVEMRIRDHGPGVPETQMRRIFEPFYRGERELTRRTKGTGIGLTLARGLIDRMGGVLRARNHPEGGFEVSIRLALA